MSGQPNSTDWSSYSLPQIRQMLSQESALAGDAQARVWYQIEAICRTHADQLARAVTQLQATWPATKGSAAEAFQAATNGLLRSMRETSRTAYNNGLTLESFNQDLQETRAQIESVVAEYQRREAAERSQPVTVAGSIEDWRAHLTTDARQIMTRNDAAARLSARIVRTPEPFVLDGGIGEGGKIKEPKPQGSGQTGQQAALGSFGSPQMTSGDSPAALPGFGGSSASVPLSPILAGAVDPGSPWGTTTPNGTSTTNVPSGRAGVSDHAVPAGAYAPGSPVGGVIGVPGGRPEAQPGAGGVRGAYGGSASGSQGAGHGLPTAGGMVGGMPMLAAGGPATTRDGVRIGRPGGVIGGERGKRSRPYDPADPWAIDADTVAPVIGGQATKESDGGPWEGLPPGVVSIEGWPR
ncbi:hypothetical protein GCM10009682_06170 [Luedemannella flava]|uniref:PPE family domain-containing protein n=1 Tax=Luedemannella flava TaxID=349316 RepID=A0ABN2LFN8_9ACTN